MKKFVPAAIVAISALTGCADQKTNSQNTGTVSEQATQQRAAETPSRPLAKFEPPAGKVLVFIGQDNESVGGTEKWQNGYVDHFGVPAGITHYVYFTEGKENRFGGKFDVGTVDGLNAETQWASGPMCMRCYLESETLANTVAHLSISMEHDDEAAVAAGEYDHNIQELVDFLKEFSHVPFLIRIGYEFDGSWNSYEPVSFRRAWRRIVDQLRANDVTNFATVLATYRLDIPDEVWEEYWPGDEYVDWLGYSYWSGGTFSDKALDFARAKGKPIFIAESTPRGFDMADSRDFIWNDWFRFFFQHIEENSDVIKAVSYINANWDGQDMWHGGGWGNTRIQDNEYSTDRWREKMAEEQYVHQTEGTYDLIRFRIGEADSTN